MTEPIIIVGGGIGGLSAALCLLDRGVPCEVYERAPALREIGAGVGLWPAALRVLDRLGLGDDVRGIGGWTNPTGIRDGDGRWLVRFEEADLQRAFGGMPVGVHRGELQAILLRALPAGTVHTGRRMVALDQGSGSVRVRFDDGSDAVGRALVGADGNRSAVRAATVGERALRDCGYFGWRGTTTWPEGVDRQNATGEWWGRRERFGFLPIGGDRITWYGSTRHFDRDGSLDEAIERYAGWPDPIGRIVASTPPDQLWSDRIFDLRPLRSWTTGRVTLLGDAAHPMTPELGQGACQAITDAQALAEEVSTGADVTLAFERYERRRKRHTAFVTLAARGLAAGGNVEHPLGQRLRAWMTAAMPAPVALAQFRAIVD